MSSLTAHLFFFFNDTAATELYTLSLHDALPICSDGARAAGPRRARCRARPPPRTRPGRVPAAAAPRRCAAPCSSPPPTARRSEEHTSELQSRQYLVCRLLLAKKKHHSS